MGKKGGHKPKGKPVVMTQAEFFQQQQAAQTEPSQSGYTALLNTMAGSRPVREEIKTPVVEPEKVERPTEVQEVSRQKDTNK